MQEKTKIKICGIKQPELAHLTGCAGADFIGLIFVPSSRRAVNVAIAQEIADAAYKGGAIPVAVFTESSADEIVRICEKTGIKWVQLHGTYSREQQHLLPDFLHRIYVYSVSPQGEVSIDNAVHHLDIKRDYLMFDSMQAGSGKTFAWKKFFYQDNFPWFLSGGLNASNVKTAIQTLHPTAVDVSSGVENAAGEKTLDLIKQFIHAVNG